MFHLINILILVSVRTSGTGTRKLPFGCGVTELSTKIWRSRNDPMPTCNVILASFSIGNGQESIEIT